MSLFVKLYSQHATVPVRATKGSAGYDLFSAVDVVIPSRGRILVDTDIGVVIPIGAYGQIASRSGLALKHGLDVGAGVIDGDYRGSICVLLFNHSDEEYQVHRGDRIAQIIIIRIEVPLVVISDELPQTSRGHGGFGSTGTSTLNQGHFDYTTLYDIFPGITP